MFYYGRLACSLITLLFGVPLNGIVIAVYRKHRSLHEATANFLIANQAAVDLFNAIIYCSLSSAPLESMKEREENIYNTYIVPYIAARVIGTFSIISSMLYFLLISSDRLFAIVRPFVYRVRVTRHGTKWRVALVWILSALLRYLYLWNFQHAFLYFVFLKVCAYLNTL